MIIPPSLKAGDTIGILSIARKIHPSEIQVAVQKFKEWGFVVKISKTIGSEYNQFSGTDKERADALQEMLDDENIKAIACARGGYGTSRILDQIDFSSFKKNPKWICGYSDITALHAHVVKNTGIAAIHSTMPVHFHKMDQDEESIDSLRNTLKGDFLIVKSQFQELNRKGKAEGRLIGGNLSILYSLSCTPSDFEYKNAVLFIEDVDEYLYHIDRMLVSMKRAGKLSNLKGLIVGGMTKMRDNEIPFGKTAEEIIAEHVAEFDFPVCYNFPVGHGDKNLSLIVGAEVKLKVGNEGGIVEYKF
jgi:muramoyltetrapeptide carboxypeptidase